MIKLVSKDWVIENIDTVLFDKDGTFIDLHYFWGKMTEMRVNEIIEKFNLPTEYFSQLCLFLGYDTNSKRMLSDGITALYSRVKIIEIFREKLKEFNINATEEEIAKLFDDVSSEFYKDIEKYTKYIDRPSNRERIYIAMLKLRLYLIYDLTRLLIRRLKNAVHSSN